MRSPDVRRDRHALYEVAVQGPEWDLDFCERVYRRRNGRDARMFREDFCSTAALAAEWVRRGRGRRAWAVDLDPEPLRWAKRHRVPWLREAASRLALVRADVRRPAKPKVDITCALNFSYWVFKQRADLLAYFRAARAGLRPGGMLVLNAFGGTRGERPLIERTRKRASNTPDGQALPPFTYVWEQARVNALTRELLAYIHFEFPNGRALRRAFTYDWRMWTLPELDESLREAGFADVQVWSEGWNEARRTHTGVLHHRRRLDNEDCWIAYVVASR